jgi:transposase InsO family protein
MWLEQDKLSNREVYTTLTEARVLIEQWCREYNQVQSHSALGYQPPGPEAVLTMVTR